MVVESSASLTRISVVPAGRPTLYSDELAQRVCEHISDGLSLKSIGQRKGMPKPRTIYKWLKEDHEFLHMYEIAKQEQADLYAEEILEIADNPDPSATNRDRLRVDARKWIASKLKPKKYGDRLDHRVDGGEIRVIVDKVKEPE